MFKLYQRKTELVFKINVCLIYNPIKKIKDGLVDKIQIKKTIQRETNDFNCYVFCSIATQY